MTRARMLAVAALAVLLGGAVLGVTATIDPVYEAKASAVVRPILGDDDLLAAIRSRDHGRFLRTSARAPFLPDGERRLPLIAAAARVPPGSVELVETGSVPVFAAFRENPRKLKAVAESEDPGRAARDATAFLREYAVERRRWYERELGEVRAYMRAKLRLRRSGASNFPSGPPYPDEELAAAEIVLRIERATLGRVRPAMVPSDPIYPDRARDTAVAALIGGLLGLLMPASWLPGRTPRRPARRR